MKMLSVRERSMTEALARVRRELGDRAVILSAHTLRDGPAWAIWRPKLVEVTAAVEQDNTGERLMHLEEAVEHLVQHLAPADQQQTDGSDCLQALGVSELARSAVRERLPDESQVPPTRPQLQLAVERLLGLPLPVGVGEEGAGPRIVALVGVTGVGKTTTLAKLAAHFTLAEQLRVGLVTSDTFRIGAIEQLRTYAQILGVPLEVVNQEPGLQEAKSRFADRDIVLVDSGGRSHHNAMAMAELRRYLTMLEPDETHLVLSLTTRTEDALAQLEAFSDLGVNRVLYTKLDECHAPTLPLEVAARRSIAASYVTTGQRVPEDIDLAAAPLLARHLMEVISFESR